MVRKTDLSLPLLRLHLCSEHGTQEPSHTTNSIFLFAFLSSELVLPGRYHTLTQPLSPLPKLQQGVGEPHASAGVQDPKTILVRPCDIACVVCRNKLMGTQRGEGDFRGGKPSDRSTAYVIFMRLCHCQQPSTFSQDMGPPRALPLHVPLHCQEQRGS